ncbi:MAG: hypothetical protein B6D68_00680 [spirochete symbiont of Stewartia floridana]|nr:MAG: hypothetical protein B6D68_00680 [spirochete symbiont of Stewartia floridana]
MKYNKLGKTAIKVSRICLGSMTWGYQNTEQDAHEQLDYAIDQGVNFIDTAEIYAVPPSEKTYGLTESYIGSYLKNHPGKRKNLIIATKIAGPGVDYIRGGSGFTPPSSIEDAVANSLKRLQIDHIDLYQLHWTHRMTPRFGILDYHHNWFSQDDKLAETLGALGKLKDKGLIREIGLSNEHPWGVMHCLMLHERDSQIPRIQSVQNVYNLVSRLADIGLSEILVREQVSLLPYSPLAGGLLSGKYQGGRQPEGARFSTWGAERMTRYINSRTDKAVNDYVELARSQNMSPVQMALSFVNDRVFVASNIIGATTMDQLKECIASEGIALSQEMLQKIETIHSKNPNPAV